MESNCIAEAEDEEEADALEFERAAEKDEEFGWRFSFSPLTALSVKSIARPVFNPTFPLSNPEATEEDDAAAGNLRCLGGVSNSDAALLEFRLESGFKSRCAAAGTDEEEEEDEAADACFARAISSSW